MRTLWQALARVGSPAAACVARVVTGTWHAIADVVRPALAPLDAVLAPLFGPWARRGAVKDLVLADQLDAAGLAEPATLLRDAAVERLVRTR